MLCNLLTNDPRIEFFTIIAGIVIVYGILYINFKRKTPLWNRLFQAVLFLLFPLAANMVFVISKGVEHILMIYSFNMFYLFAIVVTNIILKENNDKKLIEVLNKRVIPVCISIAVLVPAWCNIVFSNQLYLKEDLQQMATLSLMTRIVDDIEKTDGYEPGLTPVFFWGFLPDQQSYMTMPGFEDLQTSFVGDSPITYHGTEKAFFNYFMNYNVNVVNSADILNCGVEDFPVYPAEGSIQFVNGVLVVKISE